MKTDVMAQELLASLKSDRYLSIIPGTMTERLGAQGRDPRKLNEFLANLGQEQKQ